jgi:hypothetical protein
VYDGVREIRSDVIMKRKDEEIEKEDVEIDEN